MLNSTLRVPQAYEGFVPTRLRDVLMRLEVATSSDEVWDHLVSLAASLNLPIVDYVYATDYRNWEQAQFIRTTFPQDWAPYADANPYIRRFSNFRTHAVHYLTPVMVGIEYADCYPDLHPEKRRSMEFGAQMGMTAGFAVPLRMTERGQAGVIAFGGRYPRATFDRIVAEHGWTLHAAALSAHERYMEFFKSEFALRKLTDKQMELLRLVGRGLLDKQIAEDLGITFSAVRQRLAAITRKTGVANRAELAALAMRLGLVPDPILKAYREEMTVFLSTGSEDCQN